VRSLGRCLAAVCRHIAVNVVMQHEADDASPAATTRGAEEEAAAAAAAATAGAVADGRSSPSYYGSGDLRLHAGPGGSGGAAAAGGGAGVAPLPSGGGGEARLPWDELPCAVLQPRPGVHASLLHAHEAAAPPLAPGGGGGAGSGRGGSARRAPVTARGGVHYEGGKGGAPYPPDLLQRKAAVLVVTRELVERVGPLGRDVLWGGTTVCQLPQCAWLTSTSPSSTCLIPPSTPAALARCWARPSTWAVRRRSAWPPRAPPPAWCGRPRAGRCSTSRRPWSTPPPRATGWAGSR
jgi:hypothetical protein